MARRRISVDKIKEVIRYGVTTELSERAIGRALKVSRTAVTKYLECFRGSGLTWEQAQELPDSELLSVLEGNRPPRTSARYERLAERFPMMVKELRHKGVTLQLLWEEYLRAHLFHCGPDHLSPTTPERPRKEDVHRTCLTGALSIEQANRQ